VHFELGERMKNRTDASETLTDILYAYYSLFKQCDKGLYYIEGMTGSVGECEAAIANLSSKQGTAP